MNVADSKITIGSKPYVASSKSSGDGLFCAFASGLSMGFSDYSAEEESCKILDDGIISGGQIYAFITSSKNLTDVTVLAGVRLLSLAPLLF